MKRVSIGVVALLALIAGAACTKEALVESTYPTVEVVFDASMEGALTKSSLGIDGRTVGWSAGDAVSIYDDVTGALESSFAIVDGRIAAEVTAGATEFTSLYPYDAASTWSEGRITTTLPSVQYATAGSFAPGANLSVAHTTMQDLSLTYANVGTLIKFTLGEEDVTSVQFVGGAGEVVSGQITVEYNAGAPTYEVVGGQSAVELVNADGSALTSGATYYMVVLPGTFSEGVSLILTKSDGTFAVKTSTSSVTLARNAVTNLGTISGLNFGHDQYALYQAGQVLSIGGHIFYKTVNGEGVLVKSSENAANIITTISNHEGVYFLDDDASIGFTMEAAKTLVSTGETAIFSRSGAPVSVTPASNSTISLLDGTLAVKDIEFDLSEIGAKLCHNTKSTGDVDNIIFEGCTFKSLSYPIINTTNETSFGMSHITFDGCKFFPAANVYFVSYNSSTVLYKLGSFTFTNNVVSSTTPIQIGSLIYYKDSGVDYSSTDYAAQQWNTTVNASQNIFYNVTAKDAYIHLYSVMKQQDACVMKKDVFAATESLGGFCFKLYDEYLDVTETSKYVRVREGVRATELGSGFKAGSNVTSGATVAFKSNPQAALSAIFTTADPATGTFVLADTYKAMGPQK